MDINNRPIGEIEIGIDGIVTETDKKGEFDMVLFQVITYPLLSRAHQRA